MGAFEYNAWYEMTLFNFEVRNGPHVHVFLVTLLLLVGNLKVR